MLELYQPRPSSSSLYCPGYMYLQDYNNLYSQRKFLFVESFLFDISGDLMILSFVIQVSMLSNVSPRDSTRQKTRLIFLRLDKSEQRKELHIYKLLIKHFNTALCCLLAPPQTCFFILFTGQKLFFQCWLKSCTVKIKVKIIFD